MLKIPFLLITVSLSTMAVAVSPQHDEYYSDDIFTAIEEAKQRTHHYNYSRHKRYNRTTSQSINIPRMLNSEMDEHVIAGAVGATASGDERSATISEPLRQANLGRTITGDKLNSEQQSNAVEAPPEIQPAAGTFIREIQFSSQGISGSANNINTNVSVSATVR